MKAVQSPQHVSFQGAAVCPGALPLFKGVPPGSRWFSSKVDTLARWARPLGGTLGFGKQFLIFPKNVFLDVFVEKMDFLGSCCRENRPRKIKIISVFIPHPRVPPHLCVAACSHSASHTSTINSSPQCQIVSEYP